MAEKIKNFWQDGLSIKEYKVSALILAFWISMGFALYVFLEIKDIPSNMLFLLQTLIGAITSVNIWGKKEGEL